MNPAKIAAEIEEMAGNVLVTNMGGIYAWYPSKVKYHHINEYLPENMDLLAELIKECHKRNIYVVARFDFSKTDDAVLQARPQWFVRQADQSPHAYGLQRPGDWSLLYTTCINGGYRNDDVAVPVIKESLENYDIDGIFFNAPHYERCYCAACQKKYKETYGKDLIIPEKDSGKAPESETFAVRGAADGMEADWPSICVKENIDKIYRTIKSVKPDAPMILYYNTFEKNIYDRIATADMLCTESQNVLSRGQTNIPPLWHPTMAAKMGRTPIDTAPAPFGIIHSCPGMDWRHTGLPPAEYLYWMSQVHANGSQIWHSITGFNDTISDKRILRTVSEVNHMIQKAENDMDGAKELSPILLLWSQSDAAQGWAEALVNTQQQFDILTEPLFTEDKVSKYPLIIIPEQETLSENTIKVLKSHLENGGNVLCECINITPELSDIFGIESFSSKSEYLAASYWQFESDGISIRAGFEETPLLAHRGITSYVTPLPDTKILATLVPPFAPLDAVGAPPERASILTPQTDLPLCTQKSYNGGKAVLLPFCLSRLVKEFKLGEHYQLVENLVSMLLGDQLRLSMKSITGLHASLFEKDNKILLHLVNGVGQRPLSQSVPLSDLEITFKMLPGQSVQAVESVIAGEMIDWTEKDGQLTIQIPRLDVWDMIRMTL